MKNQIFNAKKSNIKATMSHQKNNRNDLTEKVFINHGAADIPIHLRTPYYYYEQLLCDIVTPVDNVLDLCCGNGIHTILLGKLSKSVIAVDIDKNCIELAKKRANQANIKNIDFLVSDVEYLNIGKEVFDVVTCAGSLSYVNLDNFFKVIN